MLGQRTKKAPALRSAVQKTLTKLRALSRRLGMRAFREDELREHLWSGDGLLAKYLELFANDKPLIVLDSADGCGWYEFQTMLHVMADKPFLLMLDETRHLKHFRSLKHVQTDPRFQMIGFSPYHGWALTGHE